MQVYAVTEVACKLLRGREVAILALDRGLGETACTLAILKLTRMPQRKYDVAQPNGEPPAKKALAMGEASANALTCTDWLKSRTR